MRFWVIAGLAAQAAALAHDVVETSDISKRNWWYTLCGSPDHVRTHKVNAVKARDWLETPFRLIDLPSGNGTCIDVACYLGAVITLCNTLDDTAFGIPSNIVADGATNIMLMTGCVGSNGKVSGIIMDEGGYSVTLEGNGQGKCLDIDGP